MRYITDGGQRTLFAFHFKATGIRVSSARCQVTSVWQEVNMKSVGAMFLHNNGLFKCYVRINLQNRHIQTRLETPLIRANVHAFLCRPPYTCIGLTQMCLSAPLPIYWRFAYRPPPNHQQHPSYWHILGVKFARKQRYNDLKNVNSRCQYSIGWIDSFQGFSQAIVLEIWEGTRRTYGQYTMKQIHCVEWFTMFVH